MGDSDNTGLLKFTLMPPLLPTPLVLVSRINLLNFLFSIGLAPFITVKIGSHQTIFSDFEKLVLFLETQVVSYVRSTEAVVIRGTFLNSIIV